MYIAVYVYFYGSVYDIYYSIVELGVGEIFFLNRLGKILILYMKQNCSV